MIGSHNNTQKPIQMEKHTKQHLIDACDRFIDKQDEDLQQHGVFYTLGTAIGTIKHIKNVLTEYSNND